MFTRLTDDLLDLVAAEHGCGGARLAVNLSACCSCSCCTCLAFC